MYSCRLLCFKIFSSNLKHNYSIFYDDSFRIYFHSLDQQMSSPDFTDDHLNFYRVCRLATDIIPDGLRMVFNREWDARYGVSHGLWQDAPQNARDFYNIESPRNRHRNKLLLEKMKSGKREEWDCTCLVYVILYSDSIGTGLDSSVLSSVDDLREFRNVPFCAQC